METVAVYKEERVKVYGITEKTALNLAIVRFPADRTEFWGLRIIDFENYIKRFELVTYHATNKNITELHVLFELNNPNEFYDQLRRWVNAEQNTELVIKQPVDLLYLFGPHFQDRFGIIDIAFNAFLKTNIDILVSGCAGTSMYFVTSRYQGLRCLKILKDTFLIPTII